MYKRIVAAKVRTTLRQLSDGDYEAMLAGLAPEFSYRFVGDHALSGHRTSIASMRAWWQRIFELLPGATFTPERIVVQGHPFDTRVATSVVIRATLPSGEPYENVFMQMIRLRLGRVTEIVTLEDTARLERLLGRLADQGFAAASAAPIED